MRHSKTLTHKFVDYLPDRLEPETIYVSIKFATAAHQCCCGCGREVVTPFTPTDWKLIFDGESVTLDPSIGNWSFPCQSHYFIRRNHIQWAGRWDQEQIEAGRERDAAAKRKQSGRNMNEDVQLDVGTSDKNKPTNSLFQKFKNLFRRG